MFPIEPNGDLTLVKLGLVSAILTLLGDWLLFDKFDTERLRCFGDDSFRLRV